MKVLFFAWKDKKHPTSGGAEIVLEEIAKRLVKDRHEVIIITGSFKDAKSEETIDGYKVIRMGNKVTVYILACKYYLKNLTGWADIVIEEINTIPFFTPFYVKEKRFLFFHQLAREIWFHEMPIPLSIIGYIGEPIYLWMLSRNYTITVSESSKKDLMKYGFKDKKIHIISEGIEITPVEDLQKIRKYPNPTMLSLGSIRSMKRTYDQIKAFELAKRKLPRLKLIIAGSGAGIGQGVDKYFNKVLNAIKESHFSKDIKYLGKVSKDKKIELMRKSHFITSTSIKEGWGLIVTEANSQGTPAIVYNVDGLRNAVKDKVTGYITKENNPASLAKSIQLLFKKRNIYSKLRKAGWEWSKKITFEECYKDFKKIIFKDYI